MDFRCIFFGCLFTAAGLLFALGKIHEHLAAWKNMPDEERNKIKIASLCRNIGEVIMLNGLIFLLKGLWKGFSERGFVAVMIAWLFVAGFDVWHIARSGRYQNKMDGSDERGAKDAVTRK